MKRVRKKDNSSYLSVGRFGHKRKKKKNTYEIKLMEYRLATHFVICNVHGVQALRTGRHQKPTTNLSCVSAGISFFAHSMRLFTKSKFKFN